MTAAYADVKAAWNSAAARLSVNPDQLAFASPSAMNVREILLVTKGLPADKRPMGYALAVRELQEI